MTTVSSLASPQWRHTYEQRQERPQHLRAPIVGLGVYCMYGVDSVDQLYQLYGRFYCKYPVLFPSDVTSQSDPGRFGLSS